MAGIIVASGPARTNVPGQWRLELNEAPTPAWRDRLLELVAADPVAATLHIEIEGTTMLFTSGDTQQEMLTSLRTLFKLLREANRLPPQ
jgi:hypothetical protein